MIELERGHWSFSMAANEPQPPSFWVQMTRNDEFKTLGTETRIWWWKQEVNSKILKFSLT